MTENINQKSHVIGWSPSVSANGDQIVIRQNTQCFFFLNWRLAFLSLILVGHALSDKHNQVEEEKSSQKTNLELRV